MKSLAVLAVAAFALTACAEFPQSGAPVAANAAPTDEPEAAAKSEDLAEPEPTPDPAKVAANRHMKPDGDDYRYDNGMIAYSATPGWKGQRQLEIEKIHTLSKECIRANNTSPACNELIKLNTQMGKFYVQQGPGGSK